MKCFSFIVFIFMLVTSAIADDYIVMPSKSTQEKLKLGDIVYVEVLNKTGGKVFNGRRLGSLLYVLDKDEKNVYRVIVSPENKKKNDMTPNPDTFELRGFQFEKSLENYTKDFETDLKEYEIEYDGYKKYIIYLIAIFVFPFLMKGLLIIIRLSQKKRERLRKKRQLKSIILKAKTREELEKVYQYKSQIKEYINIEDRYMDEFIQAMNEIQYKKRWTEKDISMISNVVSSFKKEISGI